MNSQDNPPHESNLENAANTSALGNPYWICFSIVLAILIFLRAWFGLQYFSFPFICVSSILYLVALVILYTINRFEVPLGVFILVTVDYILCSCRFPRLVEPGGMIIASILATQFGPGLAEKFLVYAAGTIKQKDGVQTTPSITEIDKFLTASKDPEMKAVGSAITQLSAVWASFILLTGKAFLVMVKLFPSIHIALKTMKHPIAASQEYLAVACFFVLLGALVFLVFNIMHLPIDASTFKPYSEPNRISPPVTSMLTWYRGTLLLFYAVLTVWEAFVT